jgi:hypothetical protein
LAECTRREGRREEGGERREERQEEGGRREKGERRREGGRREKEGVPFQELLLEAHPSIQIQNSDPKFFAQLPFLHFLFCWWSVPGQSSELKIIVEPIAGGQKDLKEVRRED